MNPPREIITATVRRLETAGLSDLVAALVNQIHHAIRVGKGDANLDLNLSPSKKKKDEDVDDNENEKNPKRYRLTSTGHLARDAQGYLIEDPAGMAIRIKDRKPVLDKHGRPLPHKNHAIISTRAPRTTATKKKKKRGGKRKGVAPQASTTPPAATTPAASAPTPAAPAQPSSTPSASAPAAPAATPGPAAYRAPRGQTKSSSRPTTVDPNNDPTQAVEKTAGTDIEVHGTINGRTITTTIHAGQQYHLKREGDRLQLVMPGLFGKFFVANEDRGKL